MVWYAHLFQNFPQFIVIHAVKSFGIVHKIQNKSKQCFERVCHIQILLYQYSSLIGLLFLQWDILYLPLQRLLYLPITYSRPRRLTSITVMNLVLYTLGPLCIHLMEEVDSRIKCTYFLILFSRTEILAGAILFPRATTLGKGSIL